MKQTNTITLLFLILTAPFAFSQTAAEVLGEGALWKQSVKDGPAYLYLKNNTASDVFVWVNGEPQGLVSSGITAMMPREGFATNDSGLKPDGTVVANHSFGGWEKAKRINVKAAGWTYTKGVDGKSERVLVVWDVPSVGVATLESGARVWIGGEPSITDLDIERAVKFQPGGPPSGMIEALPKAVNTPPQESGIRGADTTAIGEIPVAVAPRWSGDSKNLPATKRKMEEEQSLDLRAFVGTYRGGVGTNQSTYWTDVTISRDGFVVEGNYESFSGLGSTNYASGPRVSKYRVLDATKNELT